MIHTSIDVRRSLRLKLLNRLSGSNSADSRMFNMITQISTYNSLQSKHWNMSYKMWRDLKKKKKKQIKTNKQGRNSNCSLSCPARLFLSSTPVTAPQTS